MGILARIGAGTGGLLNSLFTAYWHSLEIKDQITYLAYQINTLEEQPTSLAGVVLQNREAPCLGLLTKEEPVPCLTKIAVSF